MRLAQARTIAEQWLEILRPSCARIEIAGSIRRSKAYAHDIELIAVPKVMEELDLFGYPVGKHDLLEDAIKAMQKDESLLIVKGGPRFKKIAISEMIGIDLFIVRPPAQWGVLYMIRTGPADFSKWMVTAQASGGALPSEYVVADGTVHLRSDLQSVIQVPEEADYFTLCEMEWIPPEKRKAQWEKVKP